jgi:hypothetical protein
LVKGGKESKELEKELEGIGTDNEDKEYVVLLSVCEAGKGLGSVSER